METSHFHLGEALLGINIQVNNTAAKNDNDFQSHN